MERWKTVVGWEGLYEVSNMGRVKSLRMGLILKPTICRGYCRVSLCRINEKPKKNSIHGLVLEAFVGPRPEGFTVNHKNFIRGDNRVENLEWVTTAENLRYTQVHSRHARGVKNGSAKLTEEQVLEIRRRGATQTQSSLAKEFGIERSQLSRILSGERWRHLISAQEGKGE